METKEQQIKRLRNKYKCLVAWCHHMKSFDFYIDDQVLEAEQDNAPLDAIYKWEEEWATVLEIKNKELRELILRAAE
jgi:hypothetical protein